MCTIYNNLKSMNSVRNFFLSRISSELFAKMQIFNTHISKWGSKGEGCIKYIVKKGLAIFPSPAGDVTYQTKWHPGLGRKNR